MQNETNEWQQNNVDDVLLNTFLIKKKRYRVLLNCNTILLEREDTDNDKIQLHTEDIISVVQSTKSKTKIISNPNSTEIIQNRRLDSVFQSLIYSNGPTPAPLPTTNTSTNLNYWEQNGNSSASTVISTKESKQIQNFLTINYARRIVNSQRNCNNLRNTTVSLSSSDVNIVTLWYQTLQKILSKQRRPKHILMFINPFGGRKQGLYIYERFCKPLFNLAGVDISCVISQRPNQIRDIILSQSLDLYDAICCVGGDGTFGEVINGLMYRTLKDADLDQQRPAFIPKPILPVGVIPAGSTDTIAYSMHGTNDVRTAALRIILGSTRGLDVCSICNGTGLIRFCVSQMSYGYLGDIASESEQYRWMGPKRYEYAGAKAFLNNRGYTGEIILLAEDQNNENDEQNSKESDQCLANCLRCDQTPNYHYQKKLKRFESKSSESKEKDFKIFCHDDIVQMQNYTLNRDSNSFVQDVENDAEELNGDNQALKKYQPNADIENGNASNMSVIDSVSSSIPCDNKFDISNIKISNGNAVKMFWKSIKGTFFMISGANIICSCDRSPNGMSKFCHLGDGYIDLVLVRQTTFFNNIRFLLSMLGPNGDPRNLPFIEIHRTKKFFFRSQYESEDRSSLVGSCQPIAICTDSKKSSQWNCDGEVVHDSDVFINCHRQLINVFMRGPFLYSKNDKDNNSESSCCRR